MSARLKFEPREMAPEFAVRSQADVLPLLRAPSVARGVLVLVPRTLAAPKARPVAVVASVRPSEPVVETEEYKRRSEGQKRRFERERAERAAMWDAASVGWHR
jgi:hypothetical protein